MKIKIIEKINQQQQQQPKSTNYRKYKTNKKNLTLFYYLKLFPFIII